MAKRFENELELSLADRVKLTLFAAISIALAFTFSCSGNGNNDEQPFIDSSSSSEFSSSSSSVDELSSSSEEPSSSSVEEPSSSSSFPLCGTISYDPATQFCFNNIKIGAKCGARTEVFDPDLYECRSDSKIYLKTPVSYGGESYEAVLIGTQTWLTENLNYEASGSKCYDDDPANCVTYGRLYDWATAMAIDASCNTQSIASCGAIVSTPHQGVCPSGWHLPTDAEWSVLETFVGGSSTAGTRLKSVSDWNTGSGYVAGTDTYGFSALPGGCRNTGGSFLYVGSNGFWWTATESGSNAFLRYVNSGYENVYEGSGIKASGYSVRCVQDL
ncbi:MAG: fibrobacter succinogenes major paralogous domain-containing protein [Fibromonadaceae bacterium]|nr:fibrobacter succinogenes major paralogous domain-containing protein [Fibromonadaceae bacterium]